jgi:hypothetical protein
MTRFKSFPICPLVLAATIGMLGAISATAATDPPGPDRDRSTATMSAPGAGLFIGYGRSGASFDQAVMIGGAVVDATITLTLRDQLGGPIPYYPPEDIWLETSGGGLQDCVLGTMPDESTNLAGETSWSLPLDAVGTTLGETVHVMVAGYPLTEPGLDLVFLSGDFNSDGVFNLQDLSLFSTPYFNAYAEAADLWHDGIINLSDLTLFSGAYLVHNVCQ